MDWDVTPPAQNIPGLIASKDQRLVIGPSGPYYVALNTYMAMNEYAGPMKNKLVRQAAEYALNKNAIVQIFGGPRIAAPANQVVLPGNVGYIKDYNPYPNNGNNGDPAKSKSLLAKAGYPNGVPLKLLYATTDPAPRVAQSMQASLNKGGFKVTLVPTTGADFYGKYMLVTSARRRSGTLGHRGAGLDPRLVRQQRPLGDPAALHAPRERARATTAATTARSPTSTSTRR